MSRNGDLKYTLLKFLVLFNNIENIVSPYCFYYPSYPTLLTPSVSIYCNEKCCPDYSTNSTTACCVDTNGLTMWLVPIIITASIVGLCLIVVVIAIILCFCKNRKRKPVIPTHPNPILAQSIVVEPLAAPSYKANHYVKGGTRAPIQSMPIEKTRVQSPFDSFMRQPTIITISNDSHLPVLPASVDLA